jgi:hypothetical protein
MSTGRSSRRASCLVALTVLLVGCTGGGAPDPAPPSGGPVTGAAASTSPAAELESALTWALAERLRRNGSGSADLAELLAGPDEQARVELLTALRRVDREQPGSRRSLTAALRRVAPGTVTDDLEQVTVHLATTPVRVESYDAWHAASLRARDDARVLAAGIAQERGLGPTGTRAGSLRADLTGLLHEHVTLTVALARELAAGGADAPGARTALADNTTALAGVLGVAYPDLQEPFARAWSAHALRLEAAATAVVVSGEPSGPSLESAAGTLAAVFTPSIDGLPVERLAAELEPLLRAQLKAVESAAALDPAAASDVQRATAEVPAPVSLLSAAIAEHLRLS